MARDVHEVGGVGAVEHAELRLEPDARAMAAQEAVGDRVEGARPGKAHLRRHLAHDAPRAARHLQRGAAREGEQQDAARARALEHQVRDAVRERVGLARARAGEDQQRPRAEARRLALAGIKLVEGRDGLHRRDYRRLLYIHPAAASGPDARFRCKNVVCP